MSRILVTSALPYANGPIHLGHVAGAYLPADLYTRYQRLQGREVIHIGGTDEHGVAITIRADQEGKHPREIVDFYHREIKQAFDALQIRFDNFSRTSLPLHHQQAQRFFLRIYEKGHVYRQDTEQLYCPKCQRFLPDRYVIGTCPYCGYEQARGDQCERCGRWLEPVQLLTPRCALCGSTPELRRTFHYFFKLSAFREPLREWLESKEHWKPNVRSLALQWIREGLRDRAITRDLAWGVPVPLPEARGKVLYVWFDAPIGYISSTIEWAQKVGQPDRWKDYWLDPSTRLVHFIGKDNIVFHALIWPAMLMAHGEYILPSEIPANEFLNLMGDKFSTSRNYAVWVHDLTNRFSVDMIRFGIARILPETKDADFDPRDFQVMVNNELVNNYGNFVNRTLSFVERYLKGRAPRPPAEPDPQVHQAIQEAHQEITHYLETFEFRKALRRILALSDVANAYFDHGEPWRTRKTDPAATERTLAHCLWFVQALSLYMAPFTPESSERIWQHLGLEQPAWSLALQPSWPEGLEIRGVKPPFRKIQDSEVEALILEIRSRAQQSGVAPRPSSEEEQPMETITFEEFKKLDIRIGTIRAAEPVPGADRLLKLQVDLGEAEPRTLVAGIREAYRPEDLVGRQIVVLANLQPRKIRGIVSQGMLLAAVEDGKPVLLGPDQPVKNGTPVS